MGRKFKTLKLIHEGFETINEYDLIDSIITREEIFKRDKM